MNRRRASFLVPIGCCWQLQKCVYFLFLILAFASNVQATTVVVIWTPKLIVIAADGKPTCTDRDGKIVQCGPISTICKIGNEGSIYYAASGLYSYPLSGFDIRRIADKTFSQLKDKTDSFSFRLNLDYEVSVALAQARDSVREALRSNPNLNYGEIIVVAMEGGVLRITHRVNDISRSQITWTQNHVRSFGFYGSEESLPDDSPGDMKLIIAGERKTIIAYQTQHPEWTRMKPTKAARKLLQLEIDSSSDTVGPPN